MDRHDRAKRVRQIERLVRISSRQYPKNISRAAAALRALAEAPQDDLQREARERFLTACNDYEADHARAKSELAAAVENGWYLFEMMWRDKKGRMICPDFLAPNWKERGGISSSSTARNSGSSPSTT